jgi:LysR family transcriptional regulator, regulator for bpeEF and oprC
MDKLRAIKFFCRAVEMKSFASAAHALDVPPSVVSRVISALESDLGCRLFNRTTRRLALTDAGTGYYEGCLRLLAGMEEADAAARAGRAQPMGTLRVGYHPAFRATLGRGLGRFLSANPNVSVETILTNSPTALVDGGLDVVLRIGRVADSTFIAKQLGWSSFVTCAAPGYLDRHGRPGHPRDLAQHRAIIPGRRDEEAFTRWSFSRGKDRQIVTVPVGLVARDGVGLTDCAIGQAGVTQLYDVATRHHIESGELEAVLPNWSSGRQPVIAVLPSRRSVPAKVRAFLEFARSLVVQS